MPSAADTESTSPGKPASAARSWRGLERWNRRLHFHVGLFFLLFLWLFAITGLVLNHPEWSFAESWSKRRETNNERELTALGPEVQGDLAQAKALMSQLGIEGDILWTTTRTDPNLFDFQVRRPGYFYFIKTDFARQRATVRLAKVNLWGIAKVLHVFSGTSMDDPRNRRDWALTTLWAYSMDAVAAGLIFMVLSSLYMWWELPQKRIPGAVVLALGSLVCGLFCFGLRWLF